MRLFRFILLLFPQFFCLSSFAYNYLYINPTTGAPVGWDNSQTIRYYLDPGPWGTLTNDQAHTLVKEAMKIWENASLDANPPKFEFAGYLPEDVNGTNYQQYVNLGRCYTDDLESCPSEAQKQLQTVIIFDNDGSILNNELCRITPCSASAGAKVFSGSSANPEFIEQGIAVFSAGIIFPINSSGMSVLVHELGHLLGLAHSYVDQQGFGSEYYPTMMTAAMSGQVTLNPDDRAGISTIYPSSTFDQTATIKGKILKSDLSPMNHVNVIARNINDPICKAYSFLSGRLCEFAPTAQFCEEPPDDNSEYFITALPPGAYTLEVEEVANESLAFTLGPSLFDPFIYGDSEFWNENDSADEPNTIFTEITLAAGETRDNIDIILNRSEVTDDRIKFLPSSTFAPGPATDCPSKPSIDYAKLIGIDETPPVPSTGSGGGCALMR